MRFKVIQILYFSTIFLIILRLGFWQILKYDDLSAKAENQRLVSREISGTRGTIFFNDDSVLVSTQPTFLVFVQPKLIGKEEKTIFSRKIAEVLLKEETENIAKALSVEKTKFSDTERLKEIEKMILDKINQDRYWVSLERKVGMDMKIKLEKLNLTGLGFEQSSKRFYPEGSSSAHLLGFVGSDIYGGETGYFGIEGFYNGELKGKKGTITEEKDALGLPILIGKFISNASENGKNLKLNIDRSIQHIVEAKLKIGIEKYGAKEGSVVIMDPKTGNILALASFPSYDPAKPNDSPKENFKNPVTSDGYEPGSTFKVLVMAAAIDANAVGEDTICDNCSGPVSIGGFDIRTWNNKYQPNLNMTDTIIHSDNTGMVFAAKKLGLENFYSYMKKFGLGVTTGVDLQDEQSPDLKGIKDWREIDLATASFGQGISVTAMQVIKAVSAIANGGKLMEPHIVSEIEKEGRVFKITPKVVGQPISEDSAKKVLDMMIRAVDEGEAKVFKPKGFKIAGKTGTAQIPVAGHYDANKTIASFVGFAPADNPKFVMLVRYVEPSASIFGAETAAPTFFEIAKELFLYYGIVPAEQ